MVKLSAMTITIPMVEPRFSKGRRPDGRLDGGRMEAGSFAVMIRLRITDVAPLVIPILGIVR